MTKQPKPITSNLLPDDLIFTTTRLDLLFGGNGDIIEPPGVALRDSIGAALHGLAEQHSEDDPACGCCYCRLFRPRHIESRDDGSVKVLNLPSVFAIEVGSFPRTCFEPGDTAQIDIIAATDAAADLDYITAAARLAGVKGIGSPRVPFEVAVREQGSLLKIEKPAILASAAYLSGRTRLVVRFMTPAFIRLEDDRKFGLSFAEFIGSIINRLHHGLSHHWGDHTIADRTRDLRNNLIEQALGVVVRSVDLRWVSRDRMRYYGAKQTLSGFLGRMEYEGDLDPFWPLIIAGSLAHIGYGAAFDLGRYSFEATN